MELVYYGGGALFLVLLIFIFARSTGGGGNIKEAEVRSMIESALLSKRNGDLSQAEVQYGRALSLLESASDVDQALLCCTLKGMAEIVEKSGKISEAKAYRERMVEIWNRALNQRQDDFLIEIDFMCLESEFGASTKEVADYYEKLLAYREKTTDPKSSVFNNTIIIYSRLMRRLGEDEIADQLEEHAKGLQEGGSNV